ncbi:unknown [Bacteroides sp. CAG:545]|nr:unknown [Bacteroides sp. CAG:545]
MLLNIYSFMRTMPSDNSRQDAQRVFRWLSVIYAFSEL